MSKPINGTEPAEWAKHLRPYGKRAFWKAHRKAPLDIEPEEIAPFTEPLIERFPPKKHRKRFGVELTYEGTWFKSFTWNKWYATARDRDKAFAQHCMSRTIQQYVVVRKIER